MVPDTHAKFHNQPFIMRRAIWRHVRGHTDSLNHTLTHILTHNKPPKAGVQLFGHTSIISPSIRPYNASLRRPPSQTSYIPGEVIASALLSLSVEPSVCLLSTFFLVSKPLDCNFQMPHMPDATPTFSLPISGRTLPLLALIIADEYSSDGGGTYSSQKLAVIPLRRKGQLSAKVRI